MSDLPPEPPPSEPEVTTAAALEPGADHPVRLIVTDDLKRSRLTVFFRLLLAIPHFIWLYLWAIAAFFVLLVGWFAALINGRLPDGMHSFLTKYQRYNTHLNAYIIAARQSVPAVQRAVRRLHGRPPRRPAAAAAQMDDPPAHHPGDPGSHFDLGLPAGSLHPRLPRLVRLHRHGANAEGHARPRALLPPLRRADQLLRVAAHQSLPEPLRPHPLRPAQ